MGESRLERQIDTSPQHRRYGLAKLLRSQPPQASSGIIPLAEPTRAAHAPSGPEWVHEIKFDGFRIVAMKDNNRVRLWSRFGNELTARFSAIRDAVAGPLDRVRTSELTPRIAARGSFRSYRIAWITGRRDERFGAGGQGYN
ncbi:ATP-dependent DNA ligase [Methylocystis suflitae]|uniref:ATP-dependent DNA ligase n=1 Tax=Methylocystis suflitae TaxID=2951405 RepID=UPI003898ED8A